MNKIFALLVIYQFKHFLADYIFQGKYMLGKFKGGSDWIAPLLAHVGVHAAFTFVIALFFKPEWAYALACFDATVHFAMDRIKASPNLLGRYKALSANEYISLTVYRKSLNLTPFNDKPIPRLSEVGPDIVNIKLKSNVLFWFSLGVDQMVHHLTHYVIIWWLVS
jgi:hypothetical protein